MGGDPMTKLFKAAAAVTVAGFVSTAGLTRAEAADLTLCWAAWDPANALVELSKDFTAQTGIDDEVRVRAVAELRRPHAQRAEFRRQALRSDDRRLAVDRRLGRERLLREAQRFLRQGRNQDGGLRCRPPSMPIRPGRRARRTTGRCRRWATPIGWFYRKDWFAKPELQAEFKEKYNRDLAPPKTWTELKEIAEFFQGREIDGKKVYGAAIFTERGSEGITMGVTVGALSLRLQVREPEAALSTWKAPSTRQDAVEGLEFYKALYKCCTPPGYTDAYMQRGPRRLQIGPGRDDDELVRLLPRPVQGREGRRRQDRLLRQSGREGRGLDARRPGHLGRRQLPTTWTRRSPTSNGSPSPTCRRSGGRSAAIPATTRC